MNDETNSNSLENSDTETFFCDENKVSINDSLSTLMNTRLAGNIVETTISDADSVLLNSTKMSKKRKKLIRKINMEISNCTIEDKIHIFNVIGKKINKSDLHEEGLGVRIMFSLIDDILLSKINDLIIDAIEKTKLNLDSDPESD